MDVPSLKSFSDTQTDQHPLLSEPMETNVNYEHVINISRGNNDASSISFHDNHLPTADSVQNERTLPSSTEVTANQSAFSMLNRINSRNPSLIRRSDAYSRRRRNPLNSRLWISVDLIVNVTQIIASVVVLLLSRDEKPQAPLFEWIVGYASGCVATLPILYWRFRNCNRSSEQNERPVPVQSSQSNTSQAASYSVVTVDQALEEGVSHSRGTGALNINDEGTLRTRVKGLVDHLKMGLDFFFAVWFVVGNVWIFGGDTSPSDAPNLYRLCIVFLTFSCIGYAMPFILCATICCCLPCIISVLGIRDQSSQTKGATQDIISALPIYKFKIIKNETAGTPEGGGVFAAGTQKERSISGEDAVCCICLAKYEDNDEVRELPCLHIFHVSCIDQWLKINAQCPLCKNEVRLNNAPPSSSRPQQG